MVATNALINTNESAGNAQNGIGGAATDGTNPLSPQTNDLSMLNPAMAVTGGLPTGSNNPAVATSGAFSDYVPPVQGGGGTGITELERPRPAPVAAAPAPVAAPAATAAPPPAAGASQAQDGNWYVPNPSGAGWMLMSAYDQLSQGQRNQASYTNGDFLPINETPFDAPSGSYLNAQNQLMVSDGQGGFFRQLAPTRQANPLVQQTGHN